MSSTLLTVDPISSNSISKFWVTVAVFVWFFPCGWIVENETHALANAHTHGLTIPHETATFSTIHGNTWIVLKKVGVLEPLVIL